MKNFIAGDIVWLKSNKRPLMTIKFIEKNEACCQWFEDKTLREGVFPLTSLDKE